MISATRAAASVPSRASTSARRSTVDPLPARTGPAHDAHPGARGGVADHVAGQEVVRGAVQRDLPGAPLAVGDRHPVAVHQDLDLADVAPVDAPWLPGRALRGADAALVDADPAEGDRFPGVVA